MILIQSMSKIINNFDYQINTKNFKNFALNVSYVNINTI